MKKRTDRQIWKIGIPGKRNHLEMEQAVAQAVETKTATPVLIERIDFKSDQTNIFVSGEPASLDVMAKHLAAGKLKADVIARRVDPGDLFKPL